jgi:hypothetical protein
MQDPLEVRCHTTQRTLPVVFCYDRANIPNLKKRYELARLILPSTAQQGLTLQVEISDNRDGLTLYSAAGSLVSRQGTKDRKRGKE